MGLLNSGVLPEIITKHGCHILSAMLSQVAQILMHSQTCEVFLEHHKWIETLLSLCRANILAACSLDQVYDLFKRKFLATAEGEVAVTSILEDVSDRCRNIVGVNGSKLGGLRQEVSWEGSFVNALSQILDQVCRLRAVDDIAAQQSDSLVG